MNSVIKLITQVKFSKSKRKYCGFRNYFDRLYISIFEELQNPEAIEWFPTYLCNSNCQYCGGYDKEATSSFEELISHGDIIKIIKLSGKTGTTMWNIGGRGGEPLLYSNLIDILGKIKQYNMKGILITNGLLLDEQFIIRLINTRWDILRISLDSHIPGIHDEIRGIKGNFDKIDRALVLFKNLKKNNITFPYLICCPVISNKNYKYIREYIEYCIEKEVNEIQFMPLLNVHKGAEKLMLSDNQKKELADLLGKGIPEDRIKHNVSFIISLYKNNGDKNETGQKSDLEINPNNKLYCIHLWKTLVISEDGYLSPCSLIKNRLFKIGGSHLEAWNSEKINQLRRKILSGELIDSMCRDCCGPLRNETDDFNRYLFKK